MIVKLSALRLVLSAVVISCAVFFPLSFARAQTSTPDPSSIPSPIPTPTLTSTPTIVSTPTITPTPSPSGEDLQKKENEINELENKISQLQKDANSLSSQISVMDNQIRLTQLRINATEEEIRQLTSDIDIATEKIGKLETSLDDLTKILFNRIVATYQIGNVQPFNILLKSGSVDDFYTRVNYLRIVQAHDRRIIYDTVQARNDYSNQKQIFENKKKKVESLAKQLEAYTVQLDTEKKSKESLLSVTKNDEKRYQDLLAKARAEYQAIQGIVSGGGEETEVGVVSEGQKIASIIQGASCNSSGAHLHFIVSKSGGTENPFSYLKSVDYENCSGSSCASGDGDQFNPTGSWNWPLDPKITMNQGYGATWAVRYSYVGRIYSFHNGIDIEGSSDAVKAVKEGTLYRGSYTGSSGCRLRYVRLKHKDDGLDTFYLHINYVL